MKSILIKIWNTLKLPYNFQIFAMKRLNDQFLVGVTGIIFDDKQRILLVKHTYHRKGPSWSLPGGYLKGQEHPKEGLEREVFEETGFTISADRRLKIRTDRNSARLDIVYLGKFIKGDFTGSEEVTDSQFFEFDDLPPLTKDQLLLIDHATKLKEKLIAYVNNETKSEKHRKKRFDKIKKRLRLR